MKDVPGVSAIGAIIHWPATKFAAHCQSVCAEFFGVRHYSRDLEPVKPCEERLRTCQAKRSAVKAGSSASIKSQKRLRGEAVASAVATVKAGVRGLARSET